MSGHDLEIDLGPNARGDHAGRRLAGLDGDKPQLIRVRTDYCPPEGWKEKARSILEHGPEPERKLLCELTRRGVAVVGYAAGPEAGLQQITTIPREAAWAAGKMPRGVERLVLDCLQSIGDWPALYAFAKARLSAGSTGQPVVFGMVRALRETGEWQVLADRLPQLFAQTGHPFLMRQLALVSMKLGRNTEALFAAVKFAALSPDRSAEAETLMATALLAEGAIWPLAHLPGADVPMQDFSETGVNRLLVSSSLEDRVQGLDLAAKPGAALSALRQSGDACEPVLENARAWELWSRNPGGAIPSETEASAVGLLTYSSSNLGDDIQSLAAAQFIDAGLPLDLLDRDALAVVNRKEPRLTILNGWYGHRACAGPIWPPSPAIRPIPVSMHVSAPAIPQMLGPEGRSWFCANAPVGCRDLPTQRLMDRHGVPSRLTGCLTLTLAPPRPGPIRRQHVWAVDLDETAVASLRIAAARRGLDPVLVRSHEFTVGRRNPAFRLLLASRFLQDYAAAQLVVTSRLHAALPCIAFGTPVIVIPSEPASRRFEGLLPEQVIATRQAFRVESDRLIRKALADPVLVPAYATAPRREVEGRTGAKGANWYQRINERSSEVFEPRL